MRKKIFTISTCTALAGVLQLSPAVYAQGNDLALKIEKPQPVKNTQNNKKPTTLTLSPSATPSALPSASPSVSPSSSPEAGSQLRRNKSGAQFVLNPATGLVTVTTPSGNIHTLKLPESAINNMFKNDLIEDEIDNATESAKPATESGEIAQNENVVEQQVTETQKILGLIPVKIKMNIKINTTTGDTVVEAKSILVKIFGFLLTD